MAMYRFSSASGLKAALTSAGILGTVYYEIELSAPTLIFSTSLTNKLIRVQLNQNVSIGTSYTSGSTVVGQTVIIGRTGTFTFNGGGTLIVGTDYFAIILATNNGNPQQYIAIFCTGEDGITKFALGFQDLVGSFQVTSSYEITPTTNTAIIPVMYNLVGFQANGVNHYLWRISKIYYKYTATGALIATSPNNVKRLLKYAETLTTNASDDVAFAYGNYVDINGGSAVNVSVFGVFGQLLLIGGAV